MSSQQVGTAPFHFQNVAFIDLRTTLRAPMQEIPQHAYCRSQFVNVPLTDCNEKAGVRDQLTHHGHSEGRECIALPYGNHAKAQPAKAGGEALQGVETVDVQLARR